MNPLPVGTRSQAGRGTDNRMNSSPDYRERFDAVCERLDRATARAGRAPGEVRLVAVSKRHGPEKVAELAAYWATFGTDGTGSAGGTACPCPPASTVRRFRPIFGESYVREGVAKQEAVQGMTARMRSENVPLPCVDWHFIGHIQTNKAKEIAGRFSLVHSVDSLRVGAALQKGWDIWTAGRPVGLYDAAHAPQAVLAQVNIGREAQKSGVLPEDAEALIAGLAAMPELHVQGLMCLPPDVDDPEDARPYFKALRELRDSLQNRTGLSLPHLSMGMSHDFEAAIEEGATFVRIGTDIFGARE